MPTLLFLPGHNTQSCKLPITQANKHLPTSGAHDSVLDFFQALFFSWPFPKADQQAKRVTSQETPCITAVPNPHLLRLCLGNRPVQVTWLLFILEQSASCSRPGLVLTDVFLTFHLFLLLLSWFWHRLW